MRLSTWIERNGGRPAVAKRLGVHESAISLWLSSQRTPKWSMVYKIVELTKGKVTQREVFEETNQIARRLAKRGTK